MDIQTIASIEQISNLRGNHIIGNFDFVNSKVTFKGNDNVLISSNLETPEKIRLINTEITFNNDNSVVFLSPSDKGYSIGLAIHNNCFCYIGANNYFNGKLNLQCSEQCNIFIADDCLFSFGVWLRTSDVHLIYDLNSHRRINCSKSIFIGEHVWVGQDARIWKGTHIGSGAILGASSFSAGKRIPSNTAWGGNPARLIKKGVFFLGNSSHLFTDEETEKWSQCLNDKYIYTFDKNETLDFFELEQKVKSFITARDRAEFLLNFSRSKSKNRFYIADNDDL